MERDSIEPWLISDSEIHLPLPLMLELKACTTTYLRLIAQLGLELLIPLPHPPKRCDLKCAPLGQVPACRREI